MKNLLSLLAAAAAGFVLWNYWIGKTKRKNNGYPDNWDSLTALEQRAWLRAMSESFNKNFEVDTTAYE